MGIPEFGVSEGVRRLLGGSGIRKNVNYFRIRGLHHGMNLRYSKYVRSKAVHVGVYVVLLRQEGLRVSDSSTQVFQESLPSSVSSGG